MDYKKVLEELYGLDVPKWTLGLGRIEALLKKLGKLVEGLGKETFSLEEAAAFLKTTPETIEY